ncbi:MAG: DUF1553 domain-containing protein [Pirellulaceae bacterium]
MRLPDLSVRITSLLALSLIPLGWSGYASMNLAYINQAVTQEVADADRQQEFTATQIEFFENKVRPLLVQHCYDCHGPDADPPEGGLSLASRTEILSGGDSGPAIDLDNLAESYILSAVEYGDLFQMPPDSRLADDDVDIIRQWVMDRAPWPNDSDIALARADEFDLQKRKSEHWCWQPISRPPVPDVSDTAWPLDPLDHFILDKLEEAGLPPAVPTDRATWLRRVTFDVTGLPPTPAEFAAFVDDESPDAYEKAVDRLLASPRFGERWARHWMDLIRYAETCGHEFDYPIPNAWQYRDYLIRAFNADVPYNEFVIEHIAGDLVDDPRRHPETQINESVLGTGFWFLGEATHGPVDVKGDEAGRIDNQIDVMSKTFLGITVACARCHDHKFDAISTADYYAISGFLQSSRRQNVMLDPHRKIENLWNQSLEIANEADDKIKDLVVGSLVTLEDGGEKTMAKYMQAAVLHLQQDASWLLPGEMRVEAETLEPLAHSGGNVRPQGINGWSGGSQIWWTDGQVGDSLELELETPIAGRYELVANFTMARDYGIVQLELNGQPLGEPRDLYAEHVSRTGDTSLGEFDLPAGKQNFKLTLTGKNDKAIDAYMAGVDYFILRGKTENHSDMASTERLEAVAAEHEVDAGQLQHWIDAVADPATNSINHPLWLLRQLARLPDDLHTDASVQALQPLIEEILNAEHEASTFFGGAMTLMTDPREWFAQGPAFYDGGGFGVDATDIDNPITWPAPHSGRNGQQYRGVLRSPTFEIKHSMIHYRVKARNAKIRLIIDGFTLDEFNPLLFEGMTMDVDTGGHWQWITQASDLKNHIGRRAYIEIIDDGDGFIAVRQVEASNESVPRDYSRNIGTWILPGTDRWERATARDSLTPLELVTERVASHTWDLMRTGFGYDPHELVNFFVRHQLIPGADYKAITATVVETQKKLADVNDQVPAPEMAIGMVDGSPENEYVFVRGNHKNLGDPAPRAPLEALRDEWNFDEATSGRMDLARHMVSPGHPLTRRVIVNRIWHHLFGRGLVPSVDNLGVLGSPPSHPELLDHLANQFAEDGWSIKRLVRRILLSQTCRMSSQTNAAAAEIDPENVLYYRANVRRLQGEAIRDSILAISGELDTTMYGPGIPIHLTPFMQGRGRPGESGPLDGDGRRSVYIEVRRNFLSPMMLAFDTPIPFNSIGRRNQSNVPAQALILLNDPFVIDQAGKWAHRLIEEFPDVDMRLVYAFESTIGRRPSDMETRELQDFLESQAAALEIEEYRDHPQVWSDLCHVLFNLKEFIYIE